jgi:SH3-like domain-containing protein
MLIVHLRSYACILAILLLSGQPVYAGNIPYFASLKSKEANIRTGPSARYPIQWVYQRKSWPVKVTATFETWRKVTDMYGEVGWIHQNLLSKKRHVVVNTTDNEPLKAYQLPSNTASVTQLLENGVIAELIKCEKSWCQIKIKQDKSWVEEAALWGTDSETGGKKK